MQPKASTAATAYRLKNGLLRDWCQRPVRRGVPPSDAIRPKAGRQAGRQAYYTQEHPRIHVFEQWRLWIESKYCTRSLQHQ